MNDYSRKLVPEEVCFPCLEVWQVKQNVNNSVNTRLRYDPKRNHVVDLTTAFCFSSEIHGNYLT